MDTKKLGVPNSYLKNGMKLFKDVKSVEAYALSVFNDKNRKAISCDVYKITQGLKTIGYTVEFYFPY